MIVCVCLEVTVVAGVAVVEGTRGPTVVESVTLNKQRFCYSPYEEHLIHTKWWNVGITFEFMNGLWYAFSQKDF